MKLPIISILLLFSFSAQSETLEQLLQEIAAQVTEVKSEKYTYTQQFEYDPDHPYQINFRVIETSNKKGDGGSFCEGYPNGKSGSRDGEGLGQTM